MLADVLPFLACPNCAAELSLVDSSVRCANAHAFDLARQGYVNLVPSKASVGTGDTAAMVGARADFLRAGHYDRIVRAVVAAAQRSLADRPAGCVVDIGAGAGHYLAPVLAALPDRVGVALDISKHALRRAARAHQRAGAVGCDVWHRLPLRTGSAALAMSIFAPRNPAEVHRILDEHGTLVVVSPTSRHLAELVWKLDLLTVEPEKQERITAALAPYCELSCEDDWEFVMSLSHNDIEALVAMGPSAWHTGAGPLHERVRMLTEPLPVTASVIVSTYRRRRESR